MSWIPQFLGQVWPVEGSSSVFLGGQWLVICIIIDFQNKYVIEIRSTLCISYLINHDHLERLTY